MKTMYLSPAEWDICLDASANIALASEPYALAQDAASALRTFLGECWYDTTLGVPYYQQILGHSPPLELLKQMLISAASKVPGVVEVQVFISSAQGRTITGQVQISDRTGALSAATF